MTDIAVPENPPMTVVVQQSRDQFAAALADRIGPERFIRAAVTVLKTTPTLARCSPASIMGGLFVAAQLGLEVGGPRQLAYLVPYGNEATLIIGYRGWVELFYRAGARKVEWFIVREGDEFDQWSSGKTGKDYTWRPADTDSNRPLSGAVAQVMLPTGEVVFEHMTREQIDARRPSRATSGPWKDWYEEMALKTVMRQLAKTVRTSADEAALALAVERDGAISSRTEGQPDRIVHPPVQQTEPDGALINAADLMPTESRADT